jgi:hypothetical protein
MGFKYLSDKNFSNGTWSQITREERYFCSHLYHFLIGKEKEFVSWLNETLKTNLNTDQEWEVSFEVCFYRDYYKLKEKKLPEELRKRTFDLCLFSATDIIIIEAKVQQPFHPDQINFLKQDIIRVKDLLEEHHVTVSSLLLCSQTYLKNLDKFGDPEMLKDYEKKTWSDLYNHFQNPIFKDAEEKYKK